jgi:HJR/Mrr/RecB family endonuclease
VRNSETSFIVPTEIPFDAMKGKDLEECVYWLLDDMGAKELEWRVGASQGGAADGGRDLEAFFLTHTPDGDIRREKWWLEAKGRSKTVEAAAVKKAVLNAGGKADLDVLVIVTNTTFSNPTRDWVKDWQQHHMRPLVRLWDKNALEKLLAKHPAAVVRLFGKVQGVGS